MKFLRKSQKRKLPEIRVELPHDYTNLPDSVVNKSLSDSHSEGKPLNVFDERNCATVCALYDFNPTEPGELKFKRDDILKVAGLYGEPWRMAKNTRTGEKGLIPSNYVTEDTAIAGALAAFHPVDRVEAERRLLVPGIESGTFIIRPSLEPNIYALSVRTMRDGEAKIHHFKICHSGDYSGFYIGSHISFPSMNKLIEYYKDHDVKDCCKLTHPCEHEKPQVPSREAVKTDRLI
ncbi:hypothetical protein Aperf_G00000088548 [Anoplocephala perfoliata]